MAFIGSLRWAVDIGIPLANPGIRPNQSGSKPEGSLDSRASPSSPALAEQRAIAGFLDRETSKIDSLVAKMERLIELLQEKRSALISRAVTKGLDPKVPMKDSGVEWLGEMPAHWEVQRLKRGAKLNPTASEVRHVPRTTEVSFVPMEAINQYGGARFIANQVTRRRGRRLHIFPRWGCRNRENHALL